MDGIDISRRGFLGTLGAASALSIGMGAGLARAEEGKGAIRASSADAMQGSGTNVQVAPDDEIVAATGWAGTPEGIERNGGSTMPLEALNIYRRRYVESQTDYVKEDGTVVPAVYVKVRALIHTYGMGSGNEPRDDSFDGFMATMSEDDAQAYVDMPMGIRFSAKDFAAQSGRSLEECEDYCERLARQGWLERYSTDEGIVYHHIAYFQGVEEYPWDKVVWPSDEYPNFYPGQEGKDPYEDFGTSGTPNFYALPVSSSVVEGGEILPYDDIELFVRGRSKYAIAPCLCRWCNTRDNGLDDALPTFEEFRDGTHDDYREPEHGFLVETCIQLGDEAEYWMYKGLAREITEEEAVGYLKRSVEEGFILHALFCKDSGTICSCHADSHCYICQAYDAIGETPDEIASKPAFQQISHYRLEVDFDSCIQCGACAARCPLHAISMDGSVEGKDGYPQVSGRCERCGQCAYVCPQNARKLVQRPDDEILDLPRTHLDDYNLKAAYRFEHGLIH
jgi:ferredoxin